MDIITDRGNTLRNFAIDGPFIGVMAKQLQLTMPEWYNVTYFNKNMRYLFSPSYTAVIITPVKQVARYEPS